MAHRANKRPPGHQVLHRGPAQHAPLFRLLGIYFTMDLLLLFLFCGGLFVWSEQQAAQISTLVEERASLGGGHGVDDGRGLHRHRRHAGGGRPPPARLAALAGGDRGGVRYFNPGTVDLLLLVTFSSGDATSYTLQMPGTSPTPSGWI